MSLAKLQARLRRMEKDHVRAANLDFMAHTRGNMTDELMQHRATARDIEREELAHEIADWTDDCDAEERRERQQARRVRWNGFTYAAMRALPYYRGKPLTEAQKAVLTAMGRMSKGKARFTVAHEYIAKMAGVSVESVKRAVRRFHTDELITRHERRYRGRKSGYNIYRIQCHKLAKWASELFGIQGVTPDLHTPKGVISSATEGGQQELGLGEADDGATPCRKKALRHDEGRKATEIRQPRHKVDPYAVGKDFAVVATAAMRELGRDLDDELEPEAVAEAVERLKIELQPDFKPFFWRKALVKHGRETALLAFLETRMVRGMRRNELSDDRPWNEREPIRCANRYLAGILKSSPSECRPEITVCAKLDSRGVYTLPPALLDITRKHMAARKNLHRHASSAG